MCCLTNVMGSALSRSLVIEVAVVSRFDVPPAADRLEFVCNGSTGALSGSLTFAIKITKHQFISLSIADGILTALVAILQLWSPEISRPDRPVPESWSRVSSGLETRKIACCRGGELECPD